jgi:hypothetical protein
MNVGGHNAIQRRHRCDNILGTTDTTLSHETFYQQPVGKESVIPPPKEGITELSRNEQICEKCTGWMAVEGDELKCISCSRVRKIVPTDRDPKERSYHPSLVWLTFLGRDARFSRIKMRVKIIPKRNGPQINTHYKAFCPMCEDDVEMQMGNKRKTKKQRLIYHSCQNNHKITVITTIDKGEFIGWE